MRISVVGSGHVGLVSGACFAELGHDVTLVDNDPAKYEALQRGLCPIHEQYVPELFQRHRGTRLLFCDTLADSAGKSEAIFIAVGTPPNINGEADLSYVESVAREIAASIKDYKIVVGKSTVPVYTSEWVRKVMLLNGAPANLFDVASNPEFLKYRLPLPCSIPTSWCWMRLPCNCRITRSSPKLRRRPPMSRSF